LPGTRKFVAQNGPVAQDKIEDIRVEFYENEGEAFLIAGFTVLAFVFALALFLVQISASFSIAGAGLMAALFAAALSLCHYFWKAKGYYHKRNSELEALLNRKQTLRGTYHHDTCRKKLARVQNSAWLGLIASGVCAIICVVGAFTMPQATDSDVVTIVCVTLVFLSFGAAVYYLVRELVALKRETAPR
jgi:hypothetical protein